MRESLIREYFPKLPKFAALMYVIFICNFTCIWRLPDVYWIASSIGSTAVSHIALHAMRIHAYMES